MSILCALAHSKSNQQTLTYGLSPCRIKTRMGPALYLPLVPLPPLPRLPARLPPLLVALHPRDCSSSCPKKWVCMGHDMQHLSVVQKFAVLQVCVSSIRTTARGMHACMVRLTLCAGTFQFQMPGRAIMGLRHFNLLLPAKDKKGPPTRVKVA